MREEIGFRAIENLSPVTKKEAVIESIEKARQVKVDESLDDYILDVVRETRESPFLELGSSPRGALALRRISQAHAYCEGRDFLIPDDVKKNAVPALSHRVILKSLNGDSESVKTKKIIEEILERVPVPI